ncbi:MAG: hypothetical protein HFH59_14550 [Lachnospiraceae bacterium]|nr:hypothetical protein [Lachnospiraceae bacterium]
MELSDSKKVLVCLFFAILFLPHLIWMVAKDYVDSINYENRTAQEKPQIDWNNFASFTSGYEAYYNDSLPFRNQLIRLNSKIEYYIFNNSSNENVVIGKDGWLFYCRKDDGDPIACYKAVDLFSQEELDLIMENLVKTQRFLEDRNCEFILYIAPNKERIYYEKMPDYYGIPGKYNRVDQLVEFLKKNTSIRIVYPYDDLMEIKDECPDLALYHQVDTHWNTAGGYIGGKALLQELGIILPEINEESIILEKIPNDSADLADMLYMRKELNQEMDYEIMGYDNYQMSVDEYDFYGEYRFRCSGNADERRVLISRDSFCTAMSNVIGSQFKESRMINRASFSNDIVEEYKPDVFVYELVERYLPSLCWFSLE